VALQLAEDGRRGEGCEGDSAVGFEAIDRVDQAEAGDLEQVVEGLVGGAVAAGEALGEGEIAPDQLLADRRVLGLDETSP
jgi:hypothetical protein